MESRNQFPLGIASKTAFCNRTEETHLLVENIKSGKHTLLMATRRYGKSSLALHALKRAGLPFVEIDFYMARSEKIIESYILNGVIDLIGKALGPVDKLIASIKKYVKVLKPKLDIGAPALKLELSVEIESDPATNIKEALFLLEELLAEKQQQAVLLMNEFQNVGMIAQGSGVEAAIRHVTQKTQYLTIIFSGSNRKLLKSMFEDDTRPLYKLCWKITLGRIATEHYSKHIQKVARNIWEKELTPAALEAIFVNSERHPFYLNKLCDRLLAYYHNTPPTAAAVNKTWQIILEEDKSDAVKEISLLPIGQKKVLLQIAKGATTNISAQNNLLSMQMSSSSVFTALEGLDEKDIIERLGNRYKIINPIVKHFVLKGSGTI
jgi:AAA+ ATPase superfamily predicted ATPase